MRLVPRPPILVVAALALSATSAGAFDLDDVAERARELAAAPYRDPAGSVPRWLLDVSYDQWRDVRFRPERSLWRGGRTPYQVQFFHAGLYYDRAVVVNEIDADGVRPVPFSPDFFDYGKNDFASRVPSDLGFAGFRLHHPLKRVDYFDEVIVFLGASYFRALGRDQVYGLSARGIAVDTALPTGEEFPWFREFWIARPAPGAREIVMYALLDSPRLTGGYRFVLTPGVETHVDVDVRVFLRAAVEKLGFAPLTSMFAFGENSIRRIEDFRPEAHDSDGLLVADGTGEWIFRPLENPESLQVSEFLAVDPAGFGLVQRDRDFDHYQDLEARPDLRPSAWVAPRGDVGWGRGRVELVEIPTQNDVNDNIVAYWVPETPPPVGAPVELAYRLSWYGEHDRRSPGGRAVATRRDRGTYDGAHRFVVDFEGRPIAALEPDAPVRGVVTVGSGSGAEGVVLESRVERNPMTGGLRLVFQVRPSVGDPIDVRAFLQSGESALTETWVYRLRP